MTPYYEKYLKYKRKYLELKNNIEINQNLEKKITNIEKKKIVLNLDLEGGNLSESITSIITISDNELVGGNLTESSNFDSDSSDLVGGYDSEVTVSSISEFDSSISIEDFKL